MAGRAHQALNEIASEATLKHHRARNMLMLEAVMSAMLDTDSPHEVARILREQADILVEYV